jgi:hypothetical protein
MIYKPYERRINKFTLNNGKVYFKIAHLHFSDWLYFVRTRFDTFADAANYVRKQELHEVKKIETVRQF